MPQLKALIFDVDGTLADTERYGHRVAFNLAFADAGLEWHWSEEQYGDLLAVAGGKERIRYFIERDQPDLSSHLAAEDDLDTLVAELHRAKTRHYTRLIRAGKIPPRPGVVRLIREARAAGLRLAIATTSALENAIALIETIFAISSPNLFEVIAAGDIVAHKKPAPDIYHYVLSEMGLSPDECLVFEDSDHGLQAATQAQLTTIVTHNGYTYDQDFSAAALVLDHLGDPNNPIELPAALRTQLPDAVPSTYVTIALLQLGIFYS